MISTNPVLGFFRTSFLFLMFRVHYVRDDVGRTIKMEDGMTFRIFRHVKLRTFNRQQPEGIFIVRFRPSHMTIDQNIRFSLLPMTVFMGFRGFREKYWCVNDETGLCQGIYAWERVEDAENYSKSVAMRFMTNRSDPQSVSVRIFCHKRELDGLYDCLGANRPSDEAWHFR